SWATGGVSSYTMANFKEWLEQRHCDIKVLNELWGTSFASFADVEITIPIAKTDLYTAKGYDWRLFNKYRVTDWFTFLSNSVKSYDPDANIHIKMVPRMLPKRRRITDWIWRLYSSYLTLSVTTRRS
ncbi:MAG: beta-galactosidase, partial [Rikenellaceae bacterium]